MRKRLVLGVVLAMVCATIVRGEPSTRAILVDDLAFGASPSGLRVGDVLEWRNHDIFRHSATASDGSFDVDLPAGGVGRFTFKRPGEFSYFCRFHPGMTGTLVVAP
jgi:plastocyanin